MAARITITFKESTVEALTRKAWDIYRKEVGGKAYDGTPLPEWDTFKDTLQGRAWLRTIEGIIETNATI